MEDINFSLSVPGKIILVGEHSVLYDKKGIAVSLDKRTYLIFKEQKQAHQQLTVNFKDLNKVIVWDFKNVYDFINRDKPLTCDFNEFTISKPELIRHDEYISLINEFLNHKKEDLDPAVKAALTSLFYIVGSLLWCSSVDLCPFDIEITSDLSMGAGTGSSAAFSVCLSSAFYYYLKLKALKEDGEDRHNICNARFQPHFIEPQLCPDLTEEDRQCINKWAYCIERINHGKPSGLDNTVCTFGSAVLINGNQPGGKLPDIQPFINFPSLRILLIFSGVNRKTSDLAKRVGDLKNCVPDVVDSVMTCLDTVASSFIKVLEEIKISPVSQLTSPYRKLENLIDISQGLLTALGVSHQRLDEICSITKKRGLHSKLTGAGGGGYAYTVIAPDADERTVDAVVSDLRSSGFTVESSVIGGPGLMIHANKS